MTVSPLVNYMMTLISILSCNCICCYDPTNTSHWIFDLNKQENISYVRDGGLTSFAHLRFWQTKKQMRRHNTFSSICRDKHKSP